MKCLTSVVIVGSGLAMVSMNAIAQAASTGSGQAYPVRPIRFIVPFPPGGSTDTYARIIGLKMAEGLGQPVVLDNRAGAGGSLGAEIAAKATPDGYNIVLGQDGNLVVGQAVRKQKTYNTLTDFAPIALAVRTPLVFVVNDNSPLKTITDLIAAAKANPGKLSYASSGTASGPHVIGTYFNMVASIETLHVPYKGGMPGMVDLRAGRLSFMIASMVSSLNFVRDGRARLLAVTGEKRSHLFPDVPTLKEAGVAGFESTPWHGVLAPAKVPKEVVVRINREVVRALALPDVQKLLQLEGGSVSPSTPEEFAAFIRADVARWDKIVKQTGISVD